MTLPEIEALHADELRELVSARLVEADWAVARAARLLDTTPRRLTGLIRRLGLDGEVRARSPGRGRPAKK